MLETALTAGFLSMGMDVMLLGPVPTPAVAMLTRVDARRSRRHDLGHRTTRYVDNGIKLFGPDGYKLSDGIELEIERRMRATISKRLSPRRARPRQAHRRRAGALHRVRQVFVPQGPH